MTAPPRRPLFKPVLAAVVLASPVLLLALLDAAALVQAYWDPASTCWLKSQVEAGRRLVFPFEIHLLFFTASLQFWAPMVLLAAVLFWHLDWLRMSELPLVAVLTGAVLYGVGYEYGWMAELYRGRYALACG